MTNGPDHYRRAEQLLRLADTEPGLVAFAAVHATLAAAAATITLSAVTRETASPVVPPSEIDNDWAKIAESPPSTSAT